MDFQNRCGVVGQRDETKLYANNSDCDFRFQIPQEMAAEDPKPIVVFQQGLCPFQRPSQKP